MTSQSTDPTQALEQLLEGAGAEIVDATPGNPCHMCKGTGIHKYIDTKTGLPGERLCLGCGGKGEGDFF